MCIKEEKRARMKNTENSDYYFFVLKNETYNKRGFMICFNH